MEQLEKEKTLIGLSKATGIMPEKLKESINHLNMCIADILKFYLCTARFPLSAEDTFISENGFFKWYDIYKVGMFKSIIQ